MSSPSAWCLAQRVTADSHRLCQAVPFLAGVLVSHQDSFVFCDRAALYCGPL